MTTVTITNTFTSKTRNGGGGIPPSNLTAPVISGSSDVGSVLSTTDGTWAGTAPITYTYQWKQSGNPILGETNTTYTLVLADYAKDITCEVTATNAYGISSATSNKITCTAVAPVNTVAPVISGSSVIGSTLTSTTGTWTGTPTITYAYQWKRAGVDITGATSSTYILTVTDYNKAITCEVKASNIVAAVSAVSNSITCTGIAPSNTVAPVISGTPTVGQTLSSTTGTWTGNPTPTYAYQWKRNGSDISGATSSTYTLVQSDATFAITCAVTATNIVSSVTAVSNSLTIFDADAQTYITAATITDTTQKNAVNQLTVDVKAAGIWTKMKAIYPFLGGTATTHKWNLKNPLDTNAAYRLVFNGGWTHSSTGATPNGTNAYADTFLVPNGTLTQNSTHVSYYSRTQSNLTEIEIGASNGPNATDDKIVLEIRTSNISYYNVNGTSTYISHSDTDSRAFYIANRTASNVINGWRNNVKAATGTVVSSTPSTAKIFLSAFNRTSSTALYSNKQCAFASIGDGLTDTEASNFYTAVQAFQTTLSRNV